MAHIALQQRPSDKINKPIGAEETSGILILGVVMLAFIATRIPGPVAETADRDPGILTLAFTLARAVRNGAETAFARSEEHTSELQSRL